MTEMKELLIAFFAYYGSRALSCHFEGKDPKENSDAYGEEILAQFAAELDDYEFFLSKQLAGQKNCNNYHDSNKPTQYA